LALYAVQAGDDLVPWSWRRFRGGWAHRVPLVGGRLSCPAS
jgi:hypothetical protein